LGWQHTVDDDRSGDSNSDDDDDCTTNDVVRHSAGRSGRSWRVG
jgi:hypothetical protein